MTLNNLFSYIEQLNQIYKNLGSQKEYSLKFRGVKSYENLDCFNNTYINLKDFEDAIVSESYYTDVGNCSVVIDETGYDLSNLIYKIHFSGVTSGTGDKVEQDCYVYILSTLDEEIY